MQELLSAETPQVKSRRGYPFGSERQFHNQALMQTFEVHWSHPRSVDAWLKNQVIGTSLNVCKGRSTAGDIQIDIVKNLQPTIIADLFHLPFPDKSFDTVICDPPFDYYGSLKWIHELRRVASKRIILASNLRRIGIGNNWHVKFFVSRHKATMMMKFWQIFTFQTQELMLFTSEKSKHE